jgi:hypothetical protein
MGKGQVSNHNKGQKPGLSTDKVRVSSLSSTWMESEHEGEQRTSRTELWRCRVSRASAEVEPGRKCLVTAQPEEGIRLGQDWCANAKEIPAYSGVTFRYLLAFARCSVQ